MLNDRKRSFQKYVFAAPLLDQVQGVSDGMAVVGQGKTRVVFAKEHDDYELIRDSVRKRLLPALTRRREKAPEVGVPSL